eukprot:TRINITY_DN1009_c0_g1_i2.p1 TRINITY_DN1009_c0_g1~~TRINITY_DN1009_c0_g1_i2.p1  ORF type:complete len:217 (-),score=43.97 TRINITY_DN1009_c0_g1_i2:168-785(-)
MAAIPELHSTASSVVSSCTVLCGGVMRPSSFAITPSPVIMKRVREILFSHSASVGCVYFTEVGRVKRRLPTPSALVLFSSSASASANSAESPAGGAGGGRGEAMLFDPTCEAGEEMLSALAEAEEVKAELLELSSSVKGWLQQGEEEMAMAVVAANRAALEEQLAGEEEPGVQQAAMLVTLSRFYLLPPPLQNQQEHSNMFSMVC